MNPVIVIGLGGTGKEVLMLLRKKVVQRFGSLSRFPILGYLHIDSDRSSESQAMPSTHYLGEDISLTESEKLPLTVTGGNSWKDNVAIRDWFPTDLHIPSNFDTGCQAQRNYGRLAFAANFDPIRDRIKKLAAKVTDLQTHKGFESDHGVTPDTQLDVFVVCSLLGGTGSGMIFDFCYTARKELTGYTTLFYGYLVTGGPTAKEDQKANCYAALMELDYYNQRGFRARYPGTLLPEIESNEGPVDWMYLASGINSKGVAVPPEVIWESVADNIFAEITPGVKDRRKGIRDNIRDAGHRDGDKLGKPQSYMSFGMASIEFPALNLQDALSYRLAADSLSNWMFPQTPQEDHVKAADQDIEVWRLKPEDLEDNLLKDDAGIPQIKRINAKTSEQKAECLADALLDKTQRAALRTKLGTCLRNNDTDIERKPTIVQSGALVKQLDHRRQVLLEEVCQKRLDLRIVGLVTDGHSGGIKNARGHLDALESRLRNSIRDHQAREDHYRQETSRAYDEKSKLFQAFLDDLADNRFVVKQHVEHVLNASGHYQRAQLTFTANEMARSLLESLITQIGSLRKKIARYEAALQQHSAECQTQYERRHTSIFAGRGLSDVIVTTEDVEEIYRGAVPDALQMALVTKTEVESRIGEVNDIFTGVLDFPETVVDALVGSAKEKFAAVRDTSIAAKLERLKPDVRDNKIRAANQNAHVLIQVDSERRQSYCNIRAPENTEIVLIATPRSEAEPSLAPNGTLMRAIKSQIAIGPENLAQTLPDRSRLVWSYEFGVFSLHCVRDFAEYRKIYSKAQSRHRHTHQGIKFPDLFPGDESEIRQRAQRAVAIGKGLGFFVQEEDAETQDLAVYFHYVDRHGKHPVRLGAKWDDIEEALFANQKEKDVLAIRQDTTTLERIEEVLTRKGEQAKTRRLKEDCWASLQGYLDKLESELPGGLKNSRYQLESGLINEYRDSYDLTPPLDWEIGGGVPSHPDQSAPAKTQTRPASEAFRVQVRQRMAGGVLDELQMLKLMEEAADFDLSFGEAKQAIDEERRGGLRHDGMLEYKIEFERLWREVHGELGPGHEAFLRGKARRLGLTDEQVREIQRSVEGNLSPR